MTTLNRSAYQWLIDEDLGWLLAQPRTLAREHIADVLRWSVRVLYDGEPADAFATPQALREDGTAPR